MPVVYFGECMPNVFAYERGVKNSKNHAFVTYEWSLRALYATIDFKLSTNRLKSTSVSIQLVLTKDIKCRLYYNFYRICSAQVVTIIISNFHNIQAPNFFFHIKLAL